MPDVYETPDYELPQTVAADTPEKVKAVMEQTRGQILNLILDRAATVTELAIALDRPKSSIAHHVDVLLKNELVKVVRTRKVRAIEERFYGRTGRTIVISGGTGPGTPAVKGSFLIEAMTEAPVGEELLATLRHARIPKAKAKEFYEEVVLLAERFTSLRREGDQVFGFVAAVYPTDYPVLPEAGDHG